MQTKRYREFFAPSLDEAYKSGYFTGNMSCQEFTERITKHNPELKVHTSKDYRGVWDGENYLTGLNRTNTFPKYTIFKHDKKMDKELNFSTPEGEITHTEIINTDDNHHQILLHGWLSTLHRLERMGYKIDKRGISA